MCPSFLFHAFTHDFGGRFEARNHAGHIAQQRAARSTNNIMDLLYRLTDFTDRVKQDCLQRNIDYNLINTRQPYDVALAACLDKRSRMG